VNTIRFALALALAAVLFNPFPLYAVTRHYYIAAEKVSWDYAPSGMDLIHGRPVPGPWAGHTKWDKLRYIEYTDATFTTRKPQPIWLGILGPVIRADVGDDIIVDFWNRTSTWHSIHPHGLRYDKDSEGSMYVPSGAGARVPPGGKFTYHWHADEGSGPGKADLSSVVWWYHPHTDESSETNAGLLGPIIITGKGKARPDGAPKGIDREFVAAFMIFDEQHGKDAGMFHAINGYVFGNLPGLMMKNGEHVRWHLLGMGNEKDLHTPHWHGKTVQTGTRNTDVIELLPASMVSVDMLADNPGTWLFHCQVSDHMEAGMMATYTIYQPRQCSSPIQFSSTDFWQTPGKFYATVKNVSGKPIQKIIVSYDHLLTPQYRRHPFRNEWVWNTPIATGGDQKFEMPGWLPGYAEKVYAWVLFPREIDFQDGTTWRSQGDDCYEIVLRDKDAPSFPTLPPVLVEMKED